jgi:hypothetical protein
MKKLILAIMMFVSVSLTAKAQESVIEDPNPNAPEITFDTELIDYGTVEYDSNGLKEFKFRNTGKSPLIITNAQAGCNCTVPEWPKDPIPPGKTGIIKVKYDTKRVGAFEKSVTITSNAKTPNKVIRIKGVVKPQANPAPQDK